VDPITIACEAAKLKMARGIQPAQG
jgi:hypothetical protein